MITNRLVRVLIGVWLVLGAARLIGFLLYAGLTAVSPMDAFHLESQMVHLSWRVESRLPLYPDTTHFPYVSNVFAPVYFVAVGAIGRLTDARIDGLFTIGRILTILAWLGTSLSLVAFTWRRLGRSPALAAGVFSIGAMPMYGFGAMVRPDLTAEFLGVLGVLLIGVRSVLARTIALALLVLAALTKQTALIYLIAAAAGLVLVSRRREGVGFLVVGLGLVVALVLVLDATVLPNLRASFVVELSTPMNLRHWARLLLRIGTSAPDLLVLPALVVPLWLKGSPEDRRWVSLYVLLAAASIATSAKTGADANYFLGLRAPEALAAGRLLAWGLEERTGHSAFKLAAFTIAGLAMIPGTWMAAFLAKNAIDSARFYASRQGLALVAGYRELYRIATIPSRSILTDSGPIALRQGTRAAFVDPFLFRLQVMNGRIKPDIVADKLRNDGYDLLILTSDVSSPEYDTYEFGLPPVLASIARERYVFVEKRVDVLLYRPRSAVAPQPR
jgi:hypothetical protein